MPTAAALKTGCASLEVLRAVRKQVGPDFPILFRYSMEEFMPGGIDMEQAVRIAKVMADNGGTC